MVFVTHDIDEALMIGHRILLIKDGKICLSRAVNGQTPRKYGEQLEERKILLQAILD